MCKYEFKQDFSEIGCNIDGKNCPYSDNQEECPAFEASDWDVMNGHYEGDPEGLEMWRKRQKGISCKTCNHYTNYEEYNIYCVSCYGYDCWTKKE